MRRLICLTLLWVAAWSAPGAKASGREDRETPVVRAVRSAKDAVVNISTTVIIEQRSSLLDDSIFDFFNIPGPLVRRIPTHSLGSGIVLHPSGYIVTNAHVVQRASEITVTFIDKTALKVTTNPYVDAEHDLAVIKVNPPRPLQALKLGRGDDLMIGETAIAIGNPLGYHHSVTTGVVSAVGRELEFQGGQVYRNLIQTDASINPGNSGGPLLNIKGELIGINTAIRGDAQNIGFAINADALSRLLPELLNAENVRRINLGFHVSPTPDHRQLRVVSVTAGSPADTSGLVVGDLIVGYDGKTLSDPIDYYVALLDHPTGKRLALALERRGKGASVALPFELKPKPDGRKLARDKLGMIIEQVQTQRRAWSRTAEGPVMVVQGVLPNSPAESVGLQRGDIIIQLGQYYVDALDEVGQILEGVRRGQRVYLGIIRIGRDVYYRTGTYLEAR